MKQTDARTIYLQDTVPFKDNYLTIELYESHVGFSNTGYVEIHLTFPVKGEKHRISKHIRVKLDEHDNS